MATLDAIDAGGDIRGEFHGLPQTNGGFEIDSYRFEAKMPQSLTKRTLLMRPFLTS